MMNTLAIVAGCLCLMSAVPGSTSASCKRRVCYQNNDRLLGTSRLVPEDIDPFLCTHLIFNFARLEMNYHFKPFTAKEEEVITKYHDKKKRNPNLKTLLAVEGYILPYAPFMKMVSDYYNRKKFIDHAITFLRKYNFDGLDVLWNYPPSASERDKDNFAHLLQEMYRAFKKEAEGSDREKLLISTYLPQDSKGVARALRTWDWYVDMINVFTFNLQENSKTGFTSHTSPLNTKKGASYSYRNRSVNFVLDTYVKLGVKKEKINVGLTTEGRSFTLADESKNEVGDKYRGRGWGRNYTRSDGHVSYQEVCEMLREGFNRRWIHDQNVPYIVKGSQWVGYENVWSIDRKVQYINSEGFGGLWIWMLDYDDFSGTFCYEGPFPLTNAAKERCQE